jgi:hypothetical protein
MKLFTEIVCQLIVLVIIIYSVQHSTLVNFEAHKKILSLEYFRIISSKLKILEPIQVWKSIKDNLGKLVKLMKWF